MLLPFLRLLAAGTAALLAGLLPSAGAYAADPVCEIERAVRFSGLNWESNLLMTNIQRFILEKGYGCQTQIETGEPLAMLAALQRGDVDVTAEIWPGQIEEAWVKALKSGKVEGVGHVFDAGEGWYVPRYTAERHPRLKRAADLAGMHTTFSDPEEPNKGRVYGCSAGWVCGTLNDNLLRALNLEDEYNMFAPGAGAAQKAAIRSAYGRKRDIVFYYWTPTALIGGLDLVKLKLPPFDQAAYTCMTSPHCKTPKATDFKTIAVVTGLNRDFSLAAPKLRAFFEKVHMPTDVIDATLGWIEIEKKEVEEATSHFLQQYPNVWRAWVPAEVAKRVQAAL
jgi:glycine betaine/proline transport system substrate-binding protein